jgi:hypothetical protein
MDHGSSASRLGHTVTEEDLSDFIVRHDDSEEGERGDSEMGERNLSGTEGLVEERSVGEDTDKDSLEDETSVSVVVDHTLLGDREGSGLADHKIGPLHAHDGDEVTTLGESKSFSSVADLGSRDNGVFVEVKTFTFVPSALRPGVGRSVNVEETDINTVVLVTVPVELGLEGFAKVVGVTVVKLGGVVDIGGIGDVTILKGESESSSRADSIIVKDVEICEESSGSLHNTNLQVSERDKLGIHEMVSLGVTGISLHDIKLGVLVGERDGGYHISSQINAKDKHGGEREGDLEDNEEQEGGNLGNVRGEGVSDRFLQVIEDKATFFNTVHDGAEVIVEQDHITSVLSDLRSTTHSNTDIGLLNGRGVIDTITGHSDDLTKVLASVNNQEFLGRSGSGEHDLGLSNPVLNLASLLNFQIVETFFLEVNCSELISMDDDGLALLHGLLFRKTLLNERIEFSLRLRDDGDLSGNSGSSVLLISSYHNNLNTSGFTFLDSQVDSRTGRIIQRDESNEVEGVHGEPSFLSEISTVFFYVAPSFPVGSIEVCIFLVLLCVEDERRETKDTLTLVTEESVSVFDSSFVFFSQLDHLTLL